MAACELVVPPPGSGRSIVRALVTVALVAAPFTAACLAGPPDGGEQTAASQTALSAAEHNVLRAENMFVTARGHVHGGRYLAARGLLEDILRLPFPDEPEARDLKAGVHLTLADIHMIQQRLVEAEAHASQGLALTGTDTSPGRLRPELLEMLADIASSRGETARAQEFRSRAESCQAILRGR